MKKPLRLNHHLYTESDSLQRFGSAQQPVLGSTIRCLVWNILKAKRRSWYRDFTHLIADRDLVLLQEAVSNAPSDSLFRSSQRFEWIMARSFRNGRTGVETGVKTGCTAQVREESFYLSPHAEPVSHTQKSLLVTRYALEGRRSTLLVLNMHAINFVTMQKYLDQLEQLLDALKGHDGPVILAGDFNTWNLRRLGHIFDINAEAGLTEAVMERPKRLTHLKQHLDHVFYRGLELRTISSLEHIQSSDHAPIAATFSLPEE